MKNILVPVGQSDNILNHVQYAVDFAADFNAKVYLVQVFDVYTKAGTLTKVDEILKKDSMEFLSSIKDQVDTKGVNIEVHALMGDLIKTLTLAAEALNIDLMMVEPRTNSVKHALWLGKTSGKMVKRSGIPTLIVPRGYQYKPISKVLFGIKNAKLSKPESLAPLAQIKAHFDATVNLLLVKTPFHTNEDFNLPTEIKSMAANISESENATTFQGILEHYRENQPDLLCVVRRNRGTFSKIWENNTIKKVDFHSTIPVLVLNRLK